MAADQLNKRPKVSNNIRHTSWELQKAKKKKSSHYDLTMRSSISLQWDDKKEHVVPKKEQISIARRELASFLPLVSHCQNVLGDVFAAPPELFELDNLTGLLSYEVWQTHLSVQEREFLTQLLPEGAEPHEVVHELLAGNNLYFGNPFPKWGASVCSGDCHPDAILRQEQCNKANKAAYYSELHKYHTEMIGSLQLWKEKWASCVNSENDFMQQILRPRKDFHKSGCSHENDILYGPEDSRGATSDSGSWDADDKSCSSESPDLTMMNGETIMRVSRMDLENKCYDSSGGWRSVARRRKGDRLHMLNVECGDGAKYMSYIKVSKEQHQRVKSSMKHSSTSIQPRSLNNVLGNLDGFCVQPYEMFEEEERQKLREHWLHLAKKDVSAGFENWKRWRSAKWQLTKSLRKEMEDKWKLNDQSVLNLYNQDEENEESRILILDGTYNATSDDVIVNATKDEEKEQLLGNLHLERLADGEKDDQLSIPPKDNEEENGESIFQTVVDVNVTNHEKAMHTDESSQDSAHNQHLPQIVIQDGGENFCPMDMNANNDVFTESDTFPCNLGEYTESMNHGDAPVGEQFPLPSAAAVSEIWPAVSLPSMYYPSVSHGYNALSLGHRRDPPEMQQQKDSLRSFLQRRSDGGDSFFYPYAANQDRNELLLHSLFKDPGSSPYLHEQKLSRLGFHNVQSSESMLGSGQFPRNLCSSLPLDIRQKRLGDVSSMHHNIQENIFSDGGGRFSIPVPIPIPIPIPRQEHLLPLNDWPGNGGVNNNNNININMPMLATSHQSQNWFPDDEVVCDGWSGVVPNHQETGGNGSDESLFSILSQCNGGEFIQPGNYVGAATDGVVNYMSGNGGQSGGGWIRTLQESGGKSWNGKGLG